MTPQSEKMKQVEAHIAALPEVIRHAIESARVPDQLRKLNQTHSLHVDQWATLQDIVMMAVVGLEEVASIPDHIKSELHLDDNASISLALDINEFIFEPIRQELERGLGSPQAKAVEDSSIETVRKEAIAAEKAAGSPVASTAPVAATPPAPKPTDKAVREQLSSAYTPAQPSHERKDISGDPYREQVQ